MSPPLTNAIVAPSGEMPGSANEGNGAMALRGAWPVAGLRPCATTITTASINFFISPPAFPALPPLLLIRTFLVEDRDVPFPFVEIRHTVLHPVWLRRVFQEVVEVLGEVHRPV